MVKKCAYCREVKKLSREHILPSWIPRRQPGSSVRFSLIDKRVSERVPTIKDVCYECNNGPLSLLDNYMLELYDQYFAKEVPKEGVVFKYDYDLLVRWLLKVIYNSARRTNSRPDEFESLTNYIIGRSDRPSNFRVLAFLLKPFTVTPRLGDKLGNYREGQEVQPRNISITLISGQIFGDIHLIIGRAVLINSFCFVVSVLPEGLGLISRVKGFAEITGMLKERFKGTQLLDSRLKEIRLNMSDVHLIDMKKDTHTLFRDAFNSYYERKNRTEAR